MIKTAVIGTGYMGVLHLKAYSTLDSSELIGFFEKDEKKRIEIEKQFSVKSFESLEALLSSEVEAVSIAASTETHFEIAKKCLEAGKNVFIEKPIASNSKQAEEIVKIAGSSGKVVTIGHIERFNPAVEKMFELLKNRKPTVFTARRIKGKPKRMRNTGVVFELAVHDIDLMLEMLGRPIEINANLIEKDELEVDAQILFKFQNASAIIHSSWLFESANIRTLDLVVNNSTISADLINQKILCDDKPIDIQFEKDLVTKEIEHFLKCVKTKQTPRVTPERGLQVMQVVEEIFKKAKRVKL